MQTDPAVEQNKNITWSVWETMESTQ